jgi:hypothetical protein
VAAITGTGHRRCGADSFPDRNGREWGVRASWRREGGGGRPSPGRGIDGAAPTPFLAGMVENGGRGLRSSIAGGGMRGWSHGEVGVDALLIILRSSIDFTVPL